MLERDMIGVVEETPELRNLIELWFSSLGYPVASADLKDVEKTYTKFLLQNNPSVLLFDVPMPYETSWQRVKSLMERPESKGREVIVMTTGVKWVEELAGKSVTLVSKPFDLNALTATVQGYLPESEPIYQEVYG